MNKVTLWLTVSLSSMNSKTWRRMGTNTYKKADWNCSRHDLHDAYEHEDDFAVIHPHCERSDRI